MLPFPKAHWYVAAFLVITFAAFMPSYFAVLPDAPWVHHLHGITATLWIVLVITQNWSAHQRSWRMHAWSGMASLPLLPIFTIGGLLVTQHTLLKDTVFKEMFGEALSIADLIVSVAFVALYTLALRHRRNPDLHARYMLSTVILLAGPSISRFFSNYVPGFLIRGLDTLPKFGDALDASMVIASVFCLYLIAMDYRNQKPLQPFIAALVATLAMFGGYYTIGTTTSYSDFATWFAGIPAWQMSVFAVVASGLPVLWAWRNPAARRGKTVTSSSDITAEHGALEQGS